MKEERVDAFLAFAQFVVTLVLLLGAATLAYFVGSRGMGKGAGTGTEAAAPAGAGAAVDVAVLIKTTPELIAKGKSLFAVNCASCHGVGGFGDGPAAVALNPKPRNFLSGEWRYGGGVARVVQTVTVGSPGTAMPAFTAIPMEDRFALAHFLRSLAPALEDDKPADLAWLGLGGAAPGAAGGIAAGMAKPGPTIPLEAALKLLTEPNASAGVVVAQAAAREASLYAERCASCHGIAGEGGVRVRMIGSAPYVYVVTTSLAVSRSGWASDPERFEKLVLRGIPGYVMPGNGDLSRGEIRDLYQHTLRLREQQGGVPASARSASSRS